ncbi:Esophageal cancer associated protein [Nesidiocoris tenuis]|uniref:Esophageal cancer associated protein n=1 Tax=Nesidiocoris tenuis TaxID=355587 RepID=A0ABN7AST6_9HEMI|nr:Esophageal cancer associated protein [Nesidiocoris tenuis]
MNSPSRWEWVTQMPKCGIPLKRLTAVETLDHPLKGVASGLPARGMSTSSERIAKTPSLAMDPLSSALDMADPLSALANETDPDEYIPKRKFSDNKEKPNPWNNRKQSILAKYTTTKKLSMASGIIAGLERSAATVARDSKETNKDQPTTIRHRLEQLDEEFETVGPKEVAFYSQQEFVENIKELGNELAQAWHQDFRVKALKIAIQGSKLLVDTSVVQFYPSKFVLITDILDEFGHLVYERLWSKSDTNQSSQLLVSESAKETCRNWFYKIASIRELIPRLYVEAAVLKSYEFLDDCEFSSALRRLVMMVRGIGDPLIAVFTRCYLVRIAISVKRTDKKLLADNFFDFLKSYGQILSNGVLVELNKNKVDIPTYLQSHIPAINWMLENLVKNSTDKEKDEIVDSCCRLANRGLLLNGILSTFDEEYVARKANFFIGQIESCSEEHFPIHILLCLLGEKLKNNYVGEPTAVLENGLRLISTIHEPADYLPCIIAWNPFITSHSSVSGLNTLLEDVIAHVSACNKKTFHASLQDIILSIVNNTSNIDTLFTMDRFLPLLDILNSDDLKAQTARRILEVISEDQRNCSTTDPVTINSLIFLSKILLKHSANFTTVDDERRQIGHLISLIIRKIDFGLDFEKQLSFYVDARATFTNLDSVLSTLVNCVNRLAMETCKKIKGQHTKKTSSFVHACAAYSFITIPSIQSDTTKLMLYLATTQVALANKCLGQADACIKAALTLIAELPLVYDVDGVSKSNEPFIQEYVKNVLSTLLVLPDCPEQGILYVTRILINVIQKYSDDSNLSFITGLYLHAIDLLAFAAQPDYIYRIKGVDSNDVLYGSDPKFIAEINKMCTVLLEQSLGNLQILGTRGEYKKQAALAFGLFTRLIHHADLESQGLATLAAQLWKLSIKHGSLDSKLLVESVRCVKSKSTLYPQKSAMSILALQLENNLKEIR